MRTATALALVLWGCTTDGVELDSTQQSTTVCGGSATVQGMDVSAYETSIDWPTAKNAGIQFAFIRATDGTQYLDPKFPTYWQGAHDAGVIRGAYQFFRPAEDPIAQADLLLSTMGTLQPGDLPPVIDVETTGGLAPADVATAVTAWVDHVTAALGRPPIVYAGFYSWHDDTGSLNMTTSPLWHAQYTTAPCPNIPVPWTQWSFWQYSSTGTVPAVMGETTDLDVFNGSLDDLKTFAASGPPPCGTIDKAGGDIAVGDACFSDGGPAATLRQATGADGPLVWTKTTTSTDEGNFAQWDLDFAEAGTYEVDVYTDTAYAQSKQASYLIAAGDGRHTVVLDQSAHDGWQSLGDFTFAAGGSQFVHLGDNTGENGMQLVFDTVRLTRVDLDGSGSNPPPTPDAPGGCQSTGVGPGAALALLAIVLRRKRITATASR